MRSHWIAGVSAVLLLVAACANSDFAATGAKKKTANEKNPGLDGKGEPGDPTSTTNPTNEEIQTQTTPTGTTGTITTDDGVIAPQVCNQASIQFISAGQNCAPHAAAYAADDAKSTQLACCPLPTRDILGKDPPQARPGQCNTDEIITGITAERTYNCTKINTVKYKLGPVTPSCYVGDGASGGNGVSGCGAPGPTMTAMTARYGSDACLGFPFGSLIVRNTGKYCRDISAVLLMDLSNNPIPMYKE
jgi:hypothetical protein